MDDQSYGHLLHILLVLVPVASRPLAVAIALPGDSTRTRQPRTLEFIRPLLCIGRPGDASLAPLARFRGCCWF